MAELSIDELRRLARNFLIGKGGEAELEDAKRAMESDPQLAMEFLQQMQTALDDVAPSGFSPQQWIEIDSRVRTLVAPLAKSGFGLGFVSRFFSRLFKKSAPSEGPARIKKKGGPPEKQSKAGSQGGPTSLLTAEAVVAPAGGGPDEGMEEMAPIAAAEAPAPEPAAAPEPEEEPAPQAASSGRAKEAAKKFFAVLLGLALLAGLGWGAWKGVQAWKNWQARKKAAMIPPPTPVPTPSPTPYDGPPRRSRPPAWQEEPLPSELPQLTPQPAGKIGRVDGLEAKEEEGRRSLPLP